MSLLFEVSYILRTWGFAALICFAYVALIQYNDQLIFALIGSLILTIFLMFSIVLYGGHVRLASRVMSGIGFHQFNCNKRKIIIGGGVSSVLRKEGLPSGKPTHMQSGRKSSKFWHAGTPIWKVRTVLAKEGKSMISHPSYASATLGGWIFTNSHGSGGTLWKSCVGALKIDEQNTDGEIVNSFTTTKKGKFFGDHISDEEARKFIIKEVEIIPVPNVIVQRKAYDVSTLNDFTKFFISCSYLRLVMINKKVMTAFTWEPTVESESNENYLVETLFPPWLASICPAWIFASISRNRWNRKMCLSDSSEFGPQEPNPVPLLSAAFLAFSFLYDNFEIFIKCHVTPKLLHRICHAIKADFESGVLRGRCEVRCGSRKLFLDFALTSARCHIPRIFMMIKNILGSATMLSLHRGKLKVDTYPLQQRTNYNANSV